MLPPPQARRAVDRHRLGSLDPFARSRDTVFVFPSLSPSAPPLFDRIITSGQIDRTDRYIESRGEEARCPPIGRKMELLIVFPTD